MLAAACCQVLTSPLPVLLYQLTEDKGFGSFYPRTSLKTLLYYLKPRIFCLSPLDLLDRYCQRRGVSVFPSFNGSFMPSLSNRSFLITFLGIKLVKTFVLHP